MRAYKQTTCCVSLTDVSRHADRLLTLTAELTAFSRGTGCTTDHGHNRSMWNATWSGNYSVLTCCDCGWSPPLETLSITVTSKQHIRSPEMHSTNYVSAHCGFHKKDWKTLLLSRFKQDWDYTYKEITRPWQHSFSQISWLTTHWQSQSEWQKGLREMQSMLAEPKIFAPPQIPFPGVRDGQNLISWR